MERTLLAWGSIPFLKYLNVLTSSLPPSLPLSLPLSLSLSLISSSALVLKTIVNFDHLEKNISLFLLGKENLVQNDQLRTPSELL